MSEELTVWVVLHSGRDFLTGARSIMVMGVFDTKPEAEQWIRDTAGEVNVDASQCSVIEASYYAQEGVSDGS